MTADFTAKYNAAYRAIGDSDRYQAEQAMRWFTTNYPDPWPVIIARRRELNAEVAATKAPGRKKPAA